MIILCGAIGDGMEEDWRGKEEEMTGLRKRPLMNEDIYGLCHYDWNHHSLEKCRG